MEIKLKAPLSSSWEVHDDYILYDATKIPFTDIVSANIFSKPAGLLNGVIQIKINSGRTIALGASSSYKKAFEEAAEYIMAHYGGEERIAQQKALDESKVYNIEGVRGRHLDVYENRVTLSTRLTAGSLLTGNVTDGQKTIYYSDCIGLQYKPSTATIGYLQFETASGLMNNKASNFFNENSFTFGADQNGLMQEVADYVRGKIEEVKAQRSAPAVAAPSAADELKKFKELLDLGIITQEEFDGKKKQLLGL